MAIGNGSGLIQSLGIGSGLDIRSLVTQLVEAERAPVAARLTRQASSLGAKVSAMGVLKGALASYQSALQPLKNAAQFLAMKAVSANAEVFSATASSSATPAELAIEVVQLAASEQLRSNNFAGGAASVVGDGALSISLGARSFTVPIASTANTLADIRTAINAASDNVGVRATLVNGQGGAQLILTGQSTGAANSIRVASSGGNGGLATLDYDGTAGGNYTVQRAAQNAIVRVAGVEKHGSSNVIGDAIDGVTLNLHAANPGSTAQLRIASDGKAVADNLRKFTDAYNALRTSIGTLASYSAASESAGPLLGDAMLKGVEQSMRRLTAEPVLGQAGGFGSLAAIGIRTDERGKLSVDATKFDSALATDGAAVAQLFGSTAGVATRLDKELTRILADDGMLAARDANLSRAQKTLNDEQARLNQRMATVEQRYLAQFTALDGLMSQLNSTSSYLSQQLDQAAAITRNSRS